MERKTEKERFNIAYNKIEGVLSRSSTNRGAQLKKIVDECFGQVPEELRERESFSLYQGCFFKACLLSDYEFAEMLFNEMFRERADGRVAYPGYIVYPAMVLEGIDDLYFGAKDSDPFLRGEQPPLSFSVSRLYYHSITDNPLLIIGETGTSKELLAMVIHRVSRRWKEKILSINCAAIPESLFESELFGHEKGSFTGAISKRMGLLEEANKGTVFLDEIGQMPTHQQTKLLRAIEEKKIRRVGGEVQITINVRFIAAAQPKYIIEGIIPDLLNRLGFPNCIQLPTLNERLRVMPDHVIGNSLRRALKGISLNLRGSGPIQLNDYTKNLLVNREYRGNYRELENILKSGIISATAKSRTEIFPDDLEEAMGISERFYGTSNTDSLFNEAALKDVLLKDSIEYANKVRASIVETKVRDLLRSGKKIKTTLQEEKATEKYENFLKKVRTITGKDVRELQGV